MIISKGLLIMMNLMPMKQNKRSKIKAEISKFYIELISFGDVYDIFKHNRANV